MRVLIDEDRQGYRWWLLRPTPTGADVVARGARPYPDRHACKRAVDILARASGEAMLVVQRSDGFWGWQVTGPDGQPLAESPAVFRDAAACGRALREVCGDLAYPPVG
ncbi:MAG TPA: hypothetical protein VJT31_20665 [Rugosimonospora sp.]|nr:hypothetical protein [Rugosimonospora sp.]